MGTLNHVANEQLEIFQKTLENLQSDINLFHHLTIDKIQQGRINLQELATYSKRVGFEDIYCYVFDGQNWQLKLSVADPLHKDTFMKVLEEYKKEICQSSIFYFSDSQKEFMFLVDSESARESIGSSLFIVKIDPEVFLQRNFYFSDWLKSSASIVYRDKVIASTNPNLKNLTVQLGADDFSFGEGLHFYETEDFFGSYQYFFQDKTYFSIAKPIAQTKFILLIDSSSIVAEKLWKKFSVYILVFMGAIFFIGIGIIIVFSKRFKRPIQKLLQAMQSVGEGDLKAHYQQTAFGFEINAIGFYFNQMVDSLKKVLEDIKNVSVKKEVLENELNLGQSVQKTLQIESHPHFAQLEIETYFQPARHVGGDFFDFVEIEKNGKKYLVIIIADTSGKGVFACLYALGLRSLLRASLVNASSIEEAIKSANKLFYRDTKSQSVFVTAFFAWVDLESYDLFYTSCGHLPMLFCENSQIIELNTKGMALGVLETIILEVKRIKMDKDAFFILYSDGIIDCMNMQEERLGKVRFLELIQVATTNSLATIKDNLIDGYKNFRGKQDPYDDETIILFGRSKL
jgi:serine phosphatase RsbU (regulator of sigma subunit)